MNMAVKEVQKKEVMDINVKRENNYCEDCIYYWCVLRSKVNMCTMKTKGLFECKSCYRKLNDNRSEKINNYPPIEYEPIITG